MKFDKKIITMLFMLFKTYIQHKIIIHATKKHSLGTFVYVLKEHEKKFFCLKWKFENMKKNKNEFKNKTLFVFHHLPRYSSAFLFHNLFFLIIIIFQSCCSWFRVTSCNNFFLCFCLFFWNLISYSYLFFLISYS